MDVEFDGMYLWPNFLKNIKLYWNIANATYCVQYYYFNYVLSSFRDTLYYICSMLCVHKYHNQYSILCHVVNSRRRKTKKGQCTSHGSSLSVDILSNARVYCLLLFFWWFVTDVIRTQYTHNMNILYYWNINLV